MVRQNIFYKGCNWEDVPNKLGGLLKLFFKSEEEQEFVWWPKWEDIRQIYVLALITEWGNLRSPKEWQEVLKFEETAEEVKTLLLDWVSKHTQEARQRIIELLNQGDFHEATKLLQSGVVEMAEWLKSQSRLDNHSGDLLKEG